MSTPQKTEKTTEERKSIYAGFSGEFDASSIEHKEASNGKKYMDVKMTGSGGAERTIRAWGDDQISALTEAVNAGEKNIQGYISAKGFMDFHRAGADKVMGVVSNVRQPETDAQPVSFVVEFEGNDGKTRKKVAKAFNENRGDLENIQNGAKIEFDAVAARDENKDGTYRSIIQAVSPIKVTEPAPKLTAEDDSPSP